MRRADGHLADLHVDRPSEMAWIDFESPSRYDLTMEWATRRKIRISRAAMAWVIRRFIDPDATFFFGSDEDVLAREAHGAIGFHVPGTRYGKQKDGPSPIEALVARHRPEDATLVRFAEIVRDADGPAGREQHPEAIGLRLMTVAFPDVLDDDNEIVHRSALLYDSLYAALSKIVGTGR